METTSGTHITDVPEVVLASIFAHLPDPTDAVALLATCRLFRALLPTAPLRLRVTPLATPLLSIRTHMRATRELDLSGCFVSDADVASLLQFLRSLERLALDNCHKLTGGAADALAAFGPRNVSLQRCFGLPSASIANLLRASRIHTLLLSHVDNLHIANDFARRASELRVLALNNCARLDVSDFIDVAILCPHLELLFLGGSFQRGRDEILFSTLVRLIELLPRLRVLELTFFAAEVVSSIRDHVDIHIWDFCELESVESARSEDALGVRGAASCSDSRKRTPLHVAAASRGDVGLVTALVAIGALVEMKDVSGSTALFLAAECGYGAVCEVLLRGGADVLASNRAGETPLYIAALKGHSAALGVMLAHCDECGVNWMEAEGYGDGWTPLMAAAVAERRGVGEMLLEAAGLFTEKSGGEGEAMNAEAACQAESMNCGESETVNAGGLVADQADKMDDEEMQTGNAEAAGVLVADQADKMDDEELQTGNAEAAGVLVADQVNGGESETEAARVLVGDQAHKRNGGESETVTAGVLVADQGDKMAAGENAGPTSQQLRRLLNRQNRYGQTALHIAAQKGSVWFIERLLTAGASLDVPNTYGFRAVDVAKRYKQTETEDILRKWESKQAPSKKSSRKARRKKDNAALAESSSAFAPEQVTDRERVDF